MQYSLKILWALFACGLCLSACDVGETGKAKEVVRRLLKDPDSAQFRDVQPCTKPGAVRGDVNGKNAYGGYVGFKPFIYADGEAAILSDTAGAYELDQFEKLSGKCYADNGTGNLLNAVDAEGDVNAMSAKLDGPAPK